MHPPNLCYALTAWLWAGSYPGSAEAALLDAHMAWLHAQQIRVIIDLTAPSDDLPAYTDTMAQHFPDMTRLAFAINYDDIPSPPQMLAILDALQAAHDAGHGVYVHSWRGMGRTVMVLACWLIRHGHTPAAALAQIAQIPQLAGQHILGYQVQTDFVMRWVEPDAATAAWWRRVRSAFRGAFLGGAVGDCIGVTNELRYPPNLGTIHGMEGGSVFGVSAGTWTDDTSLMLCVADSLITQQGFDAHDQATRFVRWWRDGYLACGGQTYDVGNVTMMALFQYIQTGNPYCQVTSEHAAGTGAIIRMAPIGLFYAATPAMLVEYAKYASMITHAAPSAVSASQVVAVLLARTLYCHDKAHLLTNAWPCAPLHDAIQEVLDGSYRTRQPPHIVNSSHVVRTLESVLWGLWHYDNYADGVLALANMGGRSGAVCTTYGQIAGAFYGESAIPAAWSALLQRREEIMCYADVLLRMAWRTLAQASCADELFDIPRSVLILKK